MRGKEWLNFFINNAIIFIILIFFIIVTIITSGGKQSFFSASNLVNIVEFSARNMFLALGVGGIIILTGTDLSAGRILGFTAVMSASFLQAAGTNSKIFPFGPWPVFIVIVIVLIIGAGFGAINGFCIAKFKLHPFIVTLATALMIFGLANLILGAAGTTVVVNTVPAYGGFYRAGFPIAKGVELHYYVFIAIAATFITWFIWNYTKLGKNMYAVGSNPEAANVSGISVNRTIILVFMYAGILYAFSGFLSGAQAMSVAVGAGEGAELYAIAACVIGGVSFTGGVGKIRGVVLGVLIITLMDFGFQWIGFSGDKAKIFTGALILFSVALDMRKYITKR